MTSTNTKKTKVRRQKLPFIFGYWSFPVAIKRTPVILHLQSVKPCETKAL